MRGWDTYPWPLLTIEWAYGMIEFQMPYVMRVRLRHSEFRSYAIQPCVKLHCHKPTYKKSRNGDTLGPVELIV